MSGHRSDRTRPAPVQRAGRSTGTPGSILSLPHVPAGTIAIAATPAGQLSAGDRCGPLRKSGLRDRFGLPLSTDSVRAAERYVEGIDRLLSWRTGAEGSFEQAIAID